MPTDTQTATLTEFLLARTAEDEEAARGATSEETGSGRTWFDGWSDTHPVGIHIGRWAPSRVLAECEAKRSVIALHPEAVARPLRPGGEWAYDEVLRRLALPYADHPDYRDEWRP